MTPTSTPQVFPLTVKQLLTAATQRFAHHVALVHDTRSYTYREIAEQANRLGHLLLAHGVGPGQPVAVLLANGPDYVIADQAIARIGAARVALTEMLSAKEIAHCLADCAATVAIVGQSMIDAAVGSGFAGAPHDHHGRWGAGDERPRTRSQP